jgi:quercetin dioxygenase-like cupin family protein
MPAPFTYRKLEEVEDVAPKFGFGEIQEARFARQALEAERTGVALFWLKPGKRQSVGHRHDEAEEVYVVLQGSGRVKLGDEIIELEALDAIRVAPGVVRAFEAGAEGMRYLVFGQHHAGDGELVRDWWSG